MTATTSRPNQRRNRLLAGGAFTAVGAVAVLGVSGALAQTKSISCTESSTYGEAIDCVVEGGVSIDWGDGVITTTDVASRAPQAVGPLEIALLDEEGLPIISSAVSIKPDLVLSCEEEPSSLKIYELADDANDKNGWGYIYIHPDTGEKVGPGHAEYPKGPGWTSWALSELGSANPTGWCTASSNAADDLGGEFSMTIESAWEEPKTVPFNTVIPWSKTHWSGTQPGDLTATVSFDSAEATERVGVFFSGCG